MTGASSDAPEGEVSMASRKSFEERIKEKEDKAQDLINQAKKYQAQSKALQKQQKEEERRKRTKQLIDIGGVVASVLGREFEEGDNIRLMNFLKMQERNGSYFSKAMNRERTENAEKSEEQAG